MTGIMAREQREALSRFELAGNLGVCPEKHSHHFDVHYYKNQNGLICILTPEEQLLYDEYVQDGSAEGLERRTELVKAAMRRPPDLLNDQPPNKRQKRE